MTWSVGRTCVFAGCLAVLSASATWAAEYEFETPFRLKAGDQLIDTQIGHAAPWVVDFDRDGKQDLLVGQFGDGKMKIHRNVGTNEHPVYAAEEWFKAEGDFGKVPAG